MSLGVAFVVSWRGPGCFVYWGRWTGQESFDVRFSPPHNATELDRRWQNSQRDMPLNGARRDLQDFSQFKNRENSFHDVHFHHDSGNVNRNQRRLYYAVVFWSDVTVMERSACCRLVANRTHGRRDIAPWTFRVVWSNTRSGSRRGSFGKVCRSS